jgi:hypothetical protein
MLEDKWGRILDNPRAPEIKSRSIEKALTIILENSMKSRNDKMLVEATNTGDIAQYTPVLISLIRRVVPTLIGNELVGVQALAQPTGRIFCQRVYYGENRATGTETWAGGPPATGSSPGAPPDPSWGGTAGGTGMTTADGEALGNEGNLGTPNYEQTRPTPWPDMSFGIDFIDVKCDTRALKGRITTEVIQDLKSVHGLDAENELAAILQAEIVAEIDREIIEKIRSVAKIGALRTTTPGTYDFDTDSDGRWSMEKVQGLLLQIEEEATDIAQETRRGRGNFIITSPQLAAYLSMANLITNLYGNTGFVEQINPVGISYYGLLCNRFKVYIDPYAVSTTNSGKTIHELIVGYKGSEIDAGIFYSPYVFSLFMRAQDSENFNTVLGCKSRYGITLNPYYQSAGATNAYYRRLSVSI